MMRYKGHNIVSSVELKLGAELHNNGLMCFSDFTLRYKIQSFLLGCGFKWITLYKYIMFVFL
jgi:hypothetical protein